MDGPPLTVITTLASVLARYSRRCPRITHREEDREARADLARTNVVSTWTTPEKLLDTPRLLTSSIIPRDRLRFSLSDSDLLLTISRPRSPATRTLDLGNDTEMHRPYAWISVVFLFTSHFRKGYLISTKLPVDQINAIDASLQDRGGTSRDSHAAML